MHGRGGRGARGRGGRGGRGRGASMSIDNRSTTLLVEHTADKVPGVVEAMKVSGNSSHGVSSSPPQRFAKFRCRADGPDPRARFSIGLLSHRCLMYVADAGARRCV